MKEIGSLCPTVMARAIAVASMMAMVIAMAMAMASGWDKVIKVEAISG